MTALDDIRTNRGAGCASRMHPVTGLARCQQHGLLQGVEAAVHEIDEATLKPVAHRGAGLAFQSRPLLALLTFWYARQIYSSTEIAARLRQDLARFNFADTELPDARTLRRFRSENRTALDACLKRVLRCLAEEKVLQGIVTHVSETHLAEEASRRIVMAMFTDSLELDKNPVAEEPAELCFIVANE